MSRFGYFKGIKRVSASLTLVSFIATNHLFIPTAAASEVPMASVEARLPKPLGEISLPAELGRIEEINLSGEKTVVLIQDAHSIPAAQAHIQQIIEFLREKYGISLITLEGASGRLDPQIFQSFPDPKILRKVFDEYHRRGELTGGNAAALFDGKGSVYHGIEDWPLYEEGLRLYQAALKEESAIEEKLRAWKSDLDKRKSKIYSEELLAIDREIIRFYGFETGLPDLLRRLAQVKSPPLGSELALILEAGEGDLKREAAIENEVKKLAEKIKGFLKPRMTSPKGREELKRFNEKLQAYQTSSLSAEGFALFLEDLAQKENLPLPLSPRLRRLIQHQIRLGQIEGTRLYRDLLEYVEAVKGSLMKTPEERALNQESDQYQLLSRLARLELTFEDWDSLSRHSDEKNLLRFFSPHLAFYQNSELRDQAFFKHLTQLMKETQSDQAVLIAGGFHTERLTRQFKEAGISYLLIRPAIPSVPKESVYRAQMQGEVSWKNYFKVEKGRVNLYQAFVRAARDRLLESYKLQVESLKFSRSAKGAVPFADSTFNFELSARSSLLKAWRDQIIRDLARQDRVKDAGQYTPLIDEAAGLAGASLPIQDGRLSEWLANVDRFVRGLGDLQSQGQLTQQNVLKLLQPSAIPAEVVSAVFSSFDSGRPQLAGLPADTVTGGVETLPSSLRVPPRFWRGEAISKSEIASSRRKATGRLMDSYQVPAQVRRPSSSRQKEAGLLAMTHTSSRSEVRGSRKEEMRERWNRILDEFEKKRGNVAGQFSLIKVIERELKRELGREEPFFTDGDLERLAGLLKETLVTVPYEPGKGDTNANVLKRDLFRVLAVLFLLGHDDTVPVAFGDFVYDHPEVTTAVGLPLPTEVEVVGLQEIQDVLRNRTKFNLLYRRRIEDRINLEFIHDLVKWSKPADSVKSWRLTTLLHYLIREAKDTKDFSSLPSEALKQDGKLQLRLSQISGVRPNDPIHPATRYTALLALQELGFSLDPKEAEAVREAAWKKIRESPRGLFSKQERDEQIQTEVVAPPVRLVEDYLKEGKRLIVIETDGASELSPNHAEFAAWEEFLRLARQGSITHLVLPVSKEFHPQFEAFYREGKIDPKFRDKELIEGHGLQDDVSELLNSELAKTEEAARNRVVRPFQRILKKLSKHLSIVLFDPYGPEEEEVTILREILKDLTARAVAYGTVGFSVTKEWPEAVRIFEVGPAALKSNSSFALRLRGTLLESAWWEVSYDRGPRPLKEFFDGFIYRAKEDEGGRHLLFSSKEWANGFVRKYPEMGKAFGRKFLIQNFETIKSIVARESKDENREYAENQVRILFRERLPSLVKLFGATWTKEHWDDLVDIGNNAGFAFVGASQALLDLASDKALGVDFIKKHWNDFYRFGTEARLGFYENIFEDLLKFIREGPGTEWTKEKWSDVVKMGLALGALDPLVELLTIRTAPSERAHQKFSPRWIQDYWEGLVQIAVSGVGKPDEVIAIDIPALRRRHGRKWLDKHWEKLVQLAVREGGGKALRHFSEGFQEVAKSMEVNGRSGDWEETSARLWLFEKSSDLLDWALASKDPNRFFEITAGRLAEAFTKDWLDLNWRSMVDFYRDLGEEAEVILTEILPSLRALSRWIDWEFFQPVLERFQKLERLFAQAFPEDAEERIRLLHGTHWLAPLITPENLIAIGQILINFAKDERLTGLDKEDERTWFFTHGLRAAAQENDFASLRELGRQMIETGSYQWWAAGRALAKAGRVLNSAEALLQREIPSETLGDHKDEFQEEIRKVREAQTSLNQFTEDPNRLIRGPVEKLRADLKKTRQTLHTRFKEAHERVRQKAKEEKGYEAWKKGVEKIIRRMIREYKRVLTDKSFKELKGRLGFEEAIASVSSGGAPSGGGGMRLSQSMEMRQEMTMVQVLAQVLEHYVGITVDEDLAQKHQDRFIRALNTIIPHEVGHVIEWNGERFELVAPEFDARRFTLLGEADLIEAVTEEVVIDAVGFALATQIYTHSEKMPAEDLTAVEKALLGLRDTVEIFLDYIQTERGAETVGGSLIPHLARLEGQLEWHLKVNQTPVRDTIREELLQLTTRMREFAHVRLSLAEERETYDRLVEAYGSHFSQVKFSLGPQPEKEKPSMGNVLGNSASFVGALLARAASSRSEARDGTTKGFEEVTGLLERKIDEGIQSWSEITKAIEESSSLIERIYLDLDKSLFSPYGYVGSEAWFLKELYFHDHTTFEMRAEWNFEETRLADLGFYREREAGLIGWIKRLQDSAIEVIGLTVRGPESRPRVEGILSHLGLELPVVYAGSLAQKKSYFKRALDDRDREVREANEKTIEATRQRLGKIQKRLSEDEFEARVLDETELTHRRAWVWVDDLAHKLSSMRERNLLKDKRVYLLRYIGKQTYSWEASHEKFLESLEKGQIDQGVASAIDFLTLLKYEAASPEGIQAYLDPRLRKLLGDGGEKRLTMAYLESVSSFLDRRADERLQPKERRELLKVYFGLLAKHNADLWVEADEKGRVAVRRKQAPPGVEFGGKYEWVIDEKTIYLFLEPLLRYLREVRPEVVILPDTGARPFRALIEAFVQAENLPTQVVIFPISRNTASDTLYELKRWLRLLKGELVPVTEEEQRLKDDLIHLKLEELLKAEHAVLLDDNLTTGETVEMIQEVLREEGKLKSLAALTPFSYRDPGSYPFPVIATFQAYGDYSWRSRGKEVASPVLVRTAWEFDRGKLRGARSRARFETPPSREVQNGEGEKFRRNLIKAFERAYKGDQELVMQRAVPTPSKPPFYREVSPQILAEPPPALSSKEWLLPHQLSLPPYLLKRQSVIPPWAFQQKALRENDLSLLSREEAFLYSIETPKAKDLGFVIFSLVQDTEGKKGVAIYKIQPQMESEKDLNPVALVEGIKSYLKATSSQKGVTGLYLDTDAWSMTGTSESHRIRRILMDHYDFLPDVDETLYVDHTLPEWAQNLNIVWKELSEEDKIKNKETEDLLAQIWRRTSGKRWALLPTFRVLLSPQEKRHLKQITQALRSGLPIRARELTFLRVWAPYHQLKESPTPTIRERIRTRTLYRELLLGQEVRGEPIRFPDGFFTSGPEWKLILRIDEALRFYLNNLWDKGADLSRLEASDLAEGGLLPVWNYFGSKGRLLEYLAPGLYERSGPKGYQPRPSALLSWEAVKGFLKGNWYSVVPGSVYTIVGTEWQPNESKVNRTIFTERPGKIIRFVDDPNHGIVGIVTDEGKEVFDYLYLHPREGLLRDAVSFNLRKRGTFSRTLGFLDIVEWAKKEGGSKIVPRPQGGSHVIGRVDAAGVLLIQKAPGLWRGGQFSVGKKYARELVIAILESDLNHGTALKIYPLKEDRRTPDWSQLLEAYYYDEGAFKTLNESFAHGRTLGFRDIVEWLKKEGGKKITPRPNGESYVKGRIGMGGKLFVSRNPRLWSWGMIQLGTRYEGRHVIGILEEDLNHGTVLKWYLLREDGQPDKTQLLDVIYVEDEKHKMLNESRAHDRTMGFLDIVEWLKKEGGRRITSRPDGESYFIGTVGSHGRVTIRKDDRLYHRGEPYVGAEYRGKEVMGILEKDLNHGTVLKWYPLKEDGKSPDRSLLLTAHYHEEGKLRALNEYMQRDDRSLGFLDIMEWLKGESGRKIIPRPEEASYVIRTVTPEGNVSIKADEKLWSTGKLSIGQEFTGQKVVGILEEDVNHGTLLKWYPSKDGKPDRSLLLNVHHYEGKELKTLNQWWSQKESRSLGFLDIVEWLKKEGGKQITPRPEGGSHVIRGVRRNGSVFVKKDPQLWSWGLFFLGRELYGQNLIGILEEIQGLGVVLGWFKYDPKSQGPVGPLLRGFAKTAHELRDVTEEVRNILKNHPTHPRAEVRSGGEEFEFEYAGRRYLVREDGILRNGEGERLGRELARELSDDPEFIRILEAIGRRRARQEPLLMEEAGGVFGEASVFWTVPVTDLVQSKAKTPGELTHKINFAMDLFEKQFGIPRDERPFALEARPTIYPGIHRIELVSRRDPSAPETLFQAFEFYLRGLLEERPEEVAREVETSGLNIKVGKEKSFAASMIARDIRVNAGTISEEVRQFLFGNDAERLKRYVHADLWSDFKQWVVHHFYEGEESPGTSLARYFNLIYQAETAASREERFNAYRQLREFLSFFHLFVGRFRIFNRPGNFFVKEPLPIDRVFPKSFHLSEAGDLRQFKEEVEQPQDPESLLIYREAIGTSSPGRARQGAGRSKRTYGVVGYRSRLYLLYRSISHSQLVEINQTGQWKRVEALMVGESGVPQWIAKPLDEAAANVSPRIAEVLDRYLAEGKISVLQDDKMEKVKEWALTLEALVDTQGQILNRDLGPSGEEVNKRRYAVPWWFAQAVEQHDRKVSPFARPPDLLRYGRIRLSGSSTTEFEIQELASGDFVLVEPNGTRHDLVEGRNQIGRRSSNNIVIYPDFVSRRHALLTLRRGKIRVEDVGTFHKGSTNGTFVKDGPSSWQRLPPVAKVELPFFRPHPARPEDQDRSEVRSRERDEEGAPSLDEITTTLPLKPKQPTESIIPRSRFLSWIVLDLLQVLVIGGMFAALLGWGAGINAALFLAYYRISDSVIIQSFDAEKRNVLRLTNRFVILLFSNAVMLMNALDAISVPAAALPALVWISFQATGNILFAREQWKSTQRVPFSQAHEKYRGDFRSTRVPYLEQKNREKPFEIEIESRWPWPLSNLWSLLQGGVVFGPAFALVYFLSVLIHETGHYLMVKRREARNSRDQKIAFERVKLHPLKWQVSKFNRYELHDSHLKDLLREAAVYASGPFFNLLSGVAALLLFPFFGVAPRALVLVAVINLFEWIWNLIPDRDSDGGRILWILGWFRFAKRLKENYPGLGQIVAGGGEIREEEQGHSLVFKTERGEIYLAKREDKLPVPSRFEAHYLSTSDFYRGWVPYKITGELVETRKGEATLRFWGKRYSVYRILDFPTHLQDRTPLRSEVRAEEDERRRVGEAAGVFVEKNKKYIEDPTAFQQLIVDGFVTGEELDFAVQRERAMTLYLHMDQAVDLKARSIVGNLLEVVPGFSAVFLGLQDEFTAKISSPSIRRVFLKMANFLNFSEGTTLEFKTLDEEGHFILRNRMPGLFRPRTVPTAGREASFETFRSRLALELWSLGNRDSPEGEAPAILPTDEGITDLAILAHNDPESLERSLESYLHNLVIFRHKNVRVHVFDDTNAGENPEIVEANQKIVEKMEAVRKKYGLANEIRYVEHKDKTAFLARLAEKVAERIQGSEYLPADVERVVQNTFARGAGGHRNFVQLVLSGRKIVMADGDSEPEVLVNPEALEKEADGETPDPGALAPTKVYLKDLENVRDDPVVHVVLPVDFISAFNRLLGKSAEALSSYARFGSEESSDETTFTPAKEPLQGIVTYVRSLVSGNHDSKWLGSSETGLLSHFFDQSEAGDFLTNWRVETVKEFFSGIHPLQTRFEGPVPSAVVLREGKGNIVTQMAFDLTRPITPFLPTRLRIEDIVYSTLHQMVYPDALSAISAVGSFHERSRSALTRKALAEEVWGEATGVYPGVALSVLLKKTIFKVDRSKVSPLAIPRAASHLLKGLNPAGRDAEWLGSLQKIVIQILAELLMVIGRAQQLSDFLARREERDDKSRRALVQSFISHFAKKLALEFPSLEAMQDEATRRAFIKKYLDSAGHLLSQTSKEEFEIWKKTFDLWEFLVEEGQALLKETPLFRRSEARSASLKLRRAGSLGVEAVVTRFAPEWMKSELRKVGIEPARAEVAAEEVIWMVQGTGDLRQVALQFRRAVLSAYSRLSAQSQRGQSPGSGDSPLYRVAFRDSVRPESILDPEKFRTVQEKIVDTLLQIKSQTVSLGLDIRPGADEFQVREPLQMLVKILQKELGDQKLELIYDLHKSKDQRALKPLMEVARTELNAFPRPHDLTRSIELRNPQPQVAVIVIGDKVGVSMNGMFLPVQVDLEGEKDVLVRDFSEILKIVVALHLTDLLAGEKTKKPGEVLKAKLLERFVDLSPALDQVIHFDGQGFTVRASVARRLLLEAETLQAVRHSA